MSDETQAPVVVVMEGEIATLWLDRPDRGNALGPALVVTLDMAIDAAATCAACSPPSARR